METEWTEDDRKERETWEKERERRKAQEAEAASVRAMWHGIRDMLVAAGCPIPLGSDVDRWFVERVGRTL